MSGIGTGTALLLGGLGAAGASIGSAAIGSSGAKKAASAQEDAANHAADLQYQASQDALKFQQQQWGTSQQNMAPWLQYGGGALSNLGYLMGITPNTSIGGIPSANPVQHTLGGSVGGTALPSGATGTTAPTGGGVAGATGGTGNFGRPSAMSNPVASPVTASGAPLSSLTGADGSVPRATGGAAMPGGSLLGGPASAIGATGDTGLSGQSPSGGFGSLMTPYSGHFTAPTELTMQNDPGYQERLKLGTDAVQRSAAARGGILTGGTLRDLNTYGQDYASNEYNNVYNRALTGFDTNYNQYNTDQANQFNRLAAIAGIGQTAAGQLSTAGQNASNNVSSNLLGTAANMGQAYQNAGAANASGIAGSANAWGGALGGIGGNLSNLYMLQQLQGLGGSGGSYGSTSGGALPTGWA